jgi:hypothetical protein
MKVVALYPEESFPVCFLIAQALPRYRIYPPQVTSAGLRYNCELK